MKQLQLTPPLLLITMGYPGAGKTFFARQFSEQHSLPRVSEERIRYELFKQPQHTPDEQTIVNRLQTHMIEEFMRTKQTIVCEGSFLTQKSRKDIYALASKQGYRTLTVWVQTDIETAKQRALQRDRRNPDNQYAFSINDQLFEKQRNRLQRPSEKEVSVVVSGKHAFKTQSVTVLRKIATIYSENMSREDFSLQPRPTITARSMPARRMVQ